LQCSIEYRPPLHPILGDGPAKQVRDAASELIQIVFENPAAIKRERPKTLGDAQQFNSSGSGSGIGSSSSSSGGGGGGGYSAPQYSSSTATNAAANAYRSSSNQNQYNDDGSKRMWGIGNPNYQAPQSSIIDRVKDGVMDAVTNLAQYGGAPVSSTTYGGGTGKPFTVPPIFIFYFCCVLNLCFVACSRAAAAITSPRARQPSRRQIPATTRRASSRPRSAQTQTSSSARLARSVAAGARPPLPLSPAPQSPRPKRRLARWPRRRPLVPTKRRRRRTTTTTTTKTKRRRKIMTHTMPTETA